MLINRKSTLIIVARKPYCKPQLEQLGDLRSMTLGSVDMGSPDSLMEGSWDNNAPAPLPPGAPGEPPWPPQLPQP